MNVKMDESALERKSCFKMLGMFLPSKLDWDSYIVFIAKTTSKKIGDLIRSMMYASPEVALYLYKSTMCPCVAYCCPALDILDKLQKREHRTVGPSLAASFEPLVHRRNVASISLFIEITLVDVHLSWPI